MITVLFSMTIKAGREDEFRELARYLSRSTHAEDDGCIAYTFYQQTDNPREFVLHEQWRDEVALTSHLNRLVAVLGPPPTPGGKLPAALLGFFEATRAVRYAVVA